MCMGKSLDSIASFALPIAAAIFAPGLLGPILGSTALTSSLGAGLATTGLGLAHGEGFGKSLEHGALAGGGSFLGSQIGGSLFPASSPAAAAVGSAAAPTGAGAITGAGSLGGSLVNDTLSSSGLGSSLTTGGFGAAAPSLAGTAAGSLTSTGGSGPGNLGGTSLLSSLGSKPLGTVGSNLNSLLGDSAGGSINNLIGSTAANTGLGAAAGGYLGSSAAQDLMGGPGTPETPPTPPFKPSRMTASSLPSSLSNLNGLDPNQQASNLATQGTFGGGIGPEEQSYYANLLNRQLVDDSGNVQSLSSLSPIESTYNQQLGLGGYNNPTDLLKALSSWSPR